MKRFIPVNELLTELRKKSVYKWIDKLTFFRIFFIWAFSIVLFGVLYFLFSNNSSYLYYPIKNQTVNSVLDSIYFSFVSATTTGFGDITPLGFFKIIAIIEVISGLMLLAFVTSKLVSIKQDAILTEIYEISFNEKINRIRSSLLLFRQNLTKIIDKIENNIIRKRDISDIYIYLSSFADILNEVLSLTGNQNKNDHFKKILDSLNTELIFNSILNSFEKLDELIILFNHNKFEWKRDITINLINACIKINESLFNRLNISNILHQKTLADLNIQKNKLMDTLKSNL